MANMYRIWQIVEEHGKLLQNTANSYRTWQIVIEHAKYYRTWQIVIEHAKYYRTALSTVEQQHPSIALTKFVHANICFERFQIFLFFKRTSLILAEKFRQHFVSNLSQYETFSGNNNITKTRIFFLRFFFFFEAKIVNNICTILEYIPADKFFEFLLNETEIRVYLPFSD